MIVLAIIGGLWLFLFFLGLMKGNSKLNLNKAIDKLSDTLKEKYTIEIVNQAINEFQSDSDFTYRCQNSRTNEEYILFLSNWFEEKCNTISVRPPFALRMSLKKLDKNLKQRGIT